MDVVTVAGAWTAAQRHAQDDSALSPGQSQGACRTITVTCDVGHVRGASCACGLCVVAATRAATGQVNLYSAGLQEVEEALYTEPRMARVER